MVAARQVGQGVLTIPAMTAILIALETSGPRCGVALLRADDSGVTVRLREHEGVQTHAERLLPMADELLADWGLRRTDIHAVAFDQGPGAFTGLRVACGVAQGLGLALGVPVMPVGSHRAVASQVQARPGEAVVVALDARMQEVYLAAYTLGEADDWRVLQAPVLMPAAVVASWSAAQLPQWSALVGQPLSGVAAGDAWAVYAAHMPLPSGWRRAFEGDSRPGADAVARLGLRDWRDGKALPADQAAPLYVRDKVAYTTIERMQGQGGNPRAALPAEAGPVIARMTAGDLDEVVALECAVQSHPWTRGNFADALAAGHGAWVLREGERDGERLLGFAVLMPAPDVAHLLVIAVACDVWRRGYGRQLLAHCEAEARRQGVPGVLLEVRPSNAAARAFYEKAGFLQIGVRRGYYPKGRGEREDALVLKKSFDGEAQT